MEVLGRTTEPEQFKACDRRPLEPLVFGERSENKSGSSRPSTGSSHEGAIADGAVGRGVAAARELMEEHPDWPEALNRLATVEYLRGEYDTSVELCKKVLAAKIHHFGALSGICMCYQKLGDEDALWPSGGSGA